LSWKNKEANLMILKSSHSSPLWFHNVCKFHEKEKNDIENLIKDHSVGLNLNDNGEVGREGKVVCF
jgi:hypothetical protein